MRYCVGIDLGTTNTVVGYCSVRDTEPPKVFAIAQLVGPGQSSKRELLPSVRYQLSDEERGSQNEMSASFVVGEHAKRLGVTASDRAIVSAKSWLSHARVDRTAAILPWGAPANVEKISPLEASASYLAHVRAMWNDAHPDAPLEQQDVVLTVPASFDESARTLTVQAAQQAGLSKLTLIEEPLAAFYDWLAFTPDRDAKLAGVRSVVIVDVGGGTTDFSLVRVDPIADGPPRLTRVAVGDHLLLGGDNMDLALARLCETRLGGERLGPQQLAQLVHACREAKEKLLASAESTPVPISVLSTGSRLVGRTRSTELTRTDVLTTLVDGFFPRVDKDEEVEQRRSAFLEFGLPYVADAAITRHLGAFLGAQKMESSAPGGAYALLLNGGVFHGEPFVQRLLEVLASWEGRRVEHLQSASPDLAVARGAAAFARARRGVGVKVASGSPRSLYLRVEGSPGEDDKLICILPRGVAEGDEHVLESRDFLLTLNRPARFHLASTHLDFGHAAGDVTDGKLAGLVELPPILAVLEALQGIAPRGDISGKSTTERVKIAATLTELGTVELSCISADDSSRRWKLAFALRGGASKSAGQDGPPVARVSELHPRFAEAKERILAAYGKADRVADPKAVKTLRTSLENVLGPREGWEAPLLRELFDSLLGVAKKRRRSADHERTWFNLAGFTLRPGRGHPLDDWRSKELEGLFEQGVQFANEPQVWTEWWIMWRRVSGGLSSAMQEQLAKTIEHALAPASGRPRPRPPGPKMLGYEDMVRLAGSLESLSSARKTELGDWLVKRVLEQNEPDRTWWAIGRLGERAPLYGSAHNVVPVADAQRWLDVAMTRKWSSGDSVVLAAAVMARATGDRVRDIDDTRRAMVLERLQKVDAPRRWYEFVREPVELADDDVRLIAGESLPPGLRLAT